MITMYGILTREGHFIDTSASLLGAKQLATREGYTHVAKRTGGNITAIWERLDGKWSGLANLSDY